MFLLKAVEFYDIPNKIHTDYGGEDTERWRLMIPVSTNSVTVPPDKFKPCNALKMTLQALSSDLMINNAGAKYVEVTNIVGHYLPNNCSLCV